MNNEKETKKITRLRYLRLEQGLSAIDLAGMANISCKSIYRYEGLTMRPSRKAAVKLCRALGVDTVNTDLTELVDVNAKWITDGRTKTLD